MNCYICGKKGYLSYQCLDRKDLKSELEKEESSDYSSEKNKKEKSKSKEKAYSAYIF